jgi:thiamine biosynthesis lipoprotein
LLVAGCASRPPVALERSEFTEPQMGIPFRIVLYAENSAAARSAARAAFDRIAALNQVCSDYEDESELTRLSRTAGSGQAVPLSDDLWRVLWRAQQFARHSSGAFDVTVGPYVQLWRRARRQREMPDPTRLAAARQAVGYEYLKLDARHRTAELRRPKMRLDLGGIAKGCALQEALKTLERFGISRALVTGGGDMAAGEAPPGKAGWQIEIAPLDVTNAPPARYVHLRRCALATSGDLFQRFEFGGRRYSHIVDPHTGIGLTDHSLVTVIARDGMTADALSTAVSVLGPEAGIRLVERQHGAAVHIVRRLDAAVEERTSRRFPRRRKRLRPRSSLVQSPALQQGQRPPAALVFLLSGIRMQSA